MKGGVTSLHSQHVTDHASQDCLQPLSSWNFEFRRIEAELVEDRGVGDR
jgi:hypothetical protein